MKSNKLLVWTAAVAAAATLAGCGKTFPFAEKLLPETYGPPFGEEVPRNQTPHPHNPGSSERHAAADSAKSKTYVSHNACLAALQAAVQPHAEAKLVTISSVEALAYYDAGGEVHEHRCTDYVLSHRSWCRFGFDGGGHGEAHRKLKTACKQQQQQSGDHH